MHLDDILTLAVLRKAYAANAKGVLVRMCYDVKVA